MSKKRRAQANRHNETCVKNHFELRTINPLTDNQERTFTSYRKGLNLVLHGSPGTGKTFISLYLALNTILHENSPYEKIVIVRSVVPSRDIGFLPGNMKEKIRVYEEPYREICDNLFDNHSGYDTLKTRGIIDFTSTSFLRGITFENSIIILDEAQNLEYHEINTVMTRLGNNSKMIVCGDFKQTDLVRKHTLSGIKELLMITDRMKSFDHIEFDISDCVRSGLVKEYLFACESLGL